MISILYFVVYVYIFCCYSWKTEVFRDIFQKDVFLRSGGKSFWNRKRKKQKTSTFSPNLILGFKLWQVLRQNTSSWSSRSLQIENSKIKKLKKKLKLTTDLGEEVVSYFETFSQQKSTYESDLWSINADYCAVKFPQQKRKAQLLAQENKPPLPEGSCWWPATEISK